MADVFKLDDYFARLGWTGPASPTFATLGGVAAAHITHIPFENLDVLLGRPPRLDLDSLQDKLVKAKRGGYCFEHMTLFSAALRAMGFDAATHSARVTMVVPLYQSARQHMFVTVKLDGATFVLDPGFGGPAPREPVLLAEGGEAGPSAAAHWMHREGDYWQLRHRDGGTAKALWVSTLERDHPVDFEMANYFVATHPNSLFTNNLMMSRFTEDGQVAVRNNRGSIVRGEATTTFDITDRRALRALLFERFGIDLPEVEALRVPAVPEWDAPSP